MTMMLHKSILWHLLRAHNETVLHQQGEPGSSSNSSSSSSISTMESTDYDGVNSTRSTSSNDTSSWLLGDSPRLRIDPESWSQALLTESGSTGNSSDPPLWIVVSGTQWYIHILWIVIILLVLLCTGAAIALLIMWNRTRRLHASTAGSTIARSDACHSTAGQPSGRARGPSSVWDNLSFYTLDNPNPNFCGGRTESGQWDTMSTDDSYLASLDRAITTGYPIQYYNNHHHQHEQLHQPQQQQQHPQPQQQQQQQQPQQQSGPGGPIGPPGGPGPSDRVVIRSNGLVRSPPDVDGLDASVRDSSVHSVRSNDTERTDL